MPVRFVTRWISLPALISGLLLNAPAIAVAQSAAYQTVVVTDDSGAQTSFAAPPQRIVSLNTGHTETVFALGAGDRLVAVDSYSNYPSAAQQVQPRLNTYPTGSIETVVSLKARPGTGAGREGRCPQRTSPTGCPRSQILSKGL